MSDLFTAAVFGLPAMAFSVGLAIWLERRAGGKAKPEMRILVVILLLVSFGACAQAQGILKRPRR